MISGRQIITTILMSMLLIATFASAASSQPLSPATHPAQPTTSAELENQAIERGDTPTSADKSIDPAPPTSGVDFSHVILALALVIALIFAMRWTLQRFAPAAVKPRTGGVMTILARCPVAPRQNLLLIKLGEKRLLVVGDTGSQLSPLASISDPQEIADISALVRRESIARANRFDSLFGLARHDYDAEEQSTDQPDAAPSAAEKSRRAPVGISISDEPSPVDAPQNVEADTDDRTDRDIADRDTAEPGTVAEHTHSSAADTLERTRVQLAGLADKVRWLARQLGTK